MNNTSYKFIPCYLFFLITLFSTGQLYAQKNIEKYVRENTVAIPTISPDSTNYADLEAFGNAIGNSRIVMLGEQYHGDAPTFLAKTRLVKYLHEKKGFNVLAFESDFFGLNYEWDRLNKTKPLIDSFINENIFGIWTQCNTCSNLFQQYIPGSFNTGTPLQLTGFDSQLFLNYSVKHVTAKVDSVIRVLQLPISLRPDYLTEILPYIDTLNRTKNAGKDSSLFNKRNLYLTEVKDEMSKKLNPNDFWMMVIDNMIAENLELKYVGRDFWKESNARDKQMAENLKWLSKVKYPNQKIIVWAHSYHISKYNGHYPESFLNNATSMGGIFTTDTAIMNKTYILGFSSYEGTAGRIQSKKYKLPKPPSYSFENWINTAYNFAFVDFKKYNLTWPGANEMFSMSASIKTPGTHTSSQAVWTKVFDGVFYIKEMYACEDTK